MSHVLSLPDNIENFVLYSDVSYHVLDDVFRQNDRVISYRSRQLNFFLKRGSDSRFSVRGIKSCVEVIVGVDQEL